MDDPLDGKIMTALLKPQPSIYELAESLKQPYPSVLRHVKRLEKSGLIATERAVRKDGKADNRKTARLRLTELGLASVIVRGNLNSEEYKLAGERLSPKGFSHIRFLASGLGITSDSILKSIFDKVRPRVNLDYFNPQYFEEIFLISFAESLFEVYGNMTESKREKLKQIAMQSVKETHGKYVGSTDEVTNEILRILERQRRSLDTRIKVLQKALRNIEKPN